MDWQSLVIDIPDYPKPGIIFKDITPLLASGEGFRAVIKEMADFITAKNLQPDVLAGPEARGFIFAAALAEHLGIGLIPLRKPGKLPRETAKVTYGLEYGKDTLEVHKDDVKPGMRIVMIDDVLATGGTMAACIQLLQSLGGNVVGAEFLLELSFLNGLDKLPAIPVNCLMQQK